MKRQQEIQKSLGQILVRIQICWRVVHVLRSRVFRMRCHENKSFKLRRLATGGGLRTGALSLLKYPIAKMTNAGLRTRSSHEGLPAPGARSVEAPCYRMWARASLTAPSSGLHSCWSKSDCSCSLAFSASATNSRRVRNANLQTSQYAVLGVLPMNRAILSFRSAIATSWQGVNAESNTLSPVSLARPALRARQSHPG
jgi:hypothetical protein